MFNLFPKIQNIILAFFDSFSDLDKSNVDPCLPAQTSADTSPASLEVAFDSKKQQRSSWRQKEMRRIHVELYARRGGVKRSGQQRCTCAARAQAVFARPAVAVVVIGGCVRCCFPFGHI